MSKNRAWMPLHIDDYLGDTDHLTAAEHGAYLLLIMKYWRDGGLPTDEGMIRRFAKMTPEQWEESRGVIASFFDANWKHGRIDAELARADEIIEKRKAAAHAKHMQSKPNAHAEQSSCTSSDTRVPPLPLTSNQDSGLLTQSSGAELGVSRETLEEAKMLWNNSGLGLPPIQRLNDTRRAAMRARFKEVGGIEGWRALLEIIGKSPHLLGENDRGWKATFDWILKPANLTKVMEGNYVRTQANPRNSLPARFDAIRAAIEGGGDQGNADSREDSFGLPGLRQSA